jgi:hypothetical protein
MKQKKRLMQVFGLTDLKIVFKCIMLKLPVRRLVQTRKQDMYEDLTKDKKQLSLCCKNIWKIIKMFSPSGMIFRMPLFLFFSL